MALRRQQGLDSPVVRRKRRCAFLSFAKTSYTE
jgi:hypothetical protein